MPRLNPQSLNKRIHLPDKFTAEQATNAVKRWFKRNHLNDGTYYVQTRLGHKIHFTGISEWHLRFDASKTHSKIAVQAIAYLPEVFEQGTHKIEKLTKNRKGKRADFVLFHVFTKEIIIDERKIRVKAKAGEYENGKIVLLPKLAAYTYSVKTAKGKSKSDLLNNNAPSSITSKGWALSSPQSFPRIKQATSIANAYGYKPSENDSVFGTSGQDCTIEILSIEPLHDNAMQIYDNISRFLGLGG